MWLLTLEQSYFQIWTAKWRVAKGWRISNHDIIFRELAIFNIILTKNG